MLLSNLLKYLLMDQPLGRLDLFETHWKTRFIRKWQFSIYFATPKLVKSLPFVHINLKPEKGILFGLIISTDVINGVHVLYHPPPGDSRLT